MILKISIAEEADLKNCLIFNLILVLVACGAEKGDEGKVSVSLENNTGTSLTTDVAPSHFGVKFTYATLREDQDSQTKSPIGIEAVIYANSNCPTYKTTEKIDDIEYEYFGSSSCSDGGEFINLARSSGEVNADLNAGQFPVPPTTYKYITLCMTGEYQFQVEGMSAIVEVDRSNDGSGGCATADLSSNPITLEEGQSIEISINYDLGSTASTQAAGSVGGAGCVNNSDNTIEYCANGANINISAQVK